MNNLLELPLLISNKKTIFKKVVLAFFIGSFWSNFSIAQNVYQPIDEGSKVHFVIKNFGIKTEGEFKGLKGTIHFNPSNLATAAFDVSVNASTIDTDNGTRDKHLKKEEYFDVAKYPTITFKGIKVTASTIAGRYFILGNLTIKAVTKQVQFGFSATEKDGGYLFESSEFEINRRDFNVGEGSFSLQDKLKINLSVFAKK
jgi:polyisoprenoid-binding protein YceI